MGRLKKKAPETGLFSQSNLIGKGWLYYKYSKLMYIPYKFLLPIESGDALRHMYQSCLSSVLDGVTVPPAYPVPLAPGDAVRARVWAGVASENVVQVDAPIPS